MDRYAIVSRRHPAFPQLVLLKYNQIASPFAETIVRECRGIILDEADDWRVVSRAFDKFFNHGEGAASPIDWATARVQEKLDGSLCVLYPYADQWHVATSGTPDAGGDINGGGMIFRDLFWRTLALYGVTLPQPERTCFYFELTSPLNRVVVVHTEASLTLLGARHLDDGEFTTDEASAMLPGRVPSVRSFGLQSFDELAASFENMSPLKQEGYVVVDRWFRRVKVKHPGYVAMHHAKDGMSTKSFVEIARSGETSEVVAAFPEFAPLLDEAKARVALLVAEVEADYGRLAGIQDQKAFALEAVKTKCPAALFAVRAKRPASVREYVATMAMEPLMRLLGYKTNR